MKIEWIWRIKEEKFVFAHTHDVCWFCSWCDCYCEKLEIREESLGALKSNQMLKIAEI